MKKLSLALTSLAMLISVAACTGNGDKEQSHEESSIVETNAEKSEKAMNNFLDKIEKGNYVIDGGEFVKVSAHSTDYVTFEHYDKSFDDYVFLVKNNEAFNGYLTEDGIEEMKYLGTGNAIKACKAKLINYWLNEEASEGNIYNLFYNDVDNPYTFMSKETVVKNTLLAYSMYTSVALNYMHDVYLELDGEDPKEAHLKVEIDEDTVARYYFEDLDIVIKFEEPKADNRVEKWLANPVYPEVGNRWSQSALSWFVSLYFPGYEEIAVPYPTFASYALTVDGTHINDLDTIYVTDSHASEENVKAYKNSLIENGFKEVKAEDERGNEIVKYRKLLREEYNCYSELMVNYEGGLNIEATIYYDLPVYNSLDETNRLVKANGFSELEQPTNVTFVESTDVTKKAIEDWCYFFDYTLSMYVTFRYQNVDEMNAYLNAYAKKLMNNGYAPVEKLDDDYKIVVDHYNSSNGCGYVQFIYRENNQVTIHIRSYRYRSGEEMSNIINAAGYPEIHFTDEISVKDMKKYYELVLGFEIYLFVAIDQPFDTLQQAEDFLDEYCDTLMKSGFERVNPEEAGVNKSVAFYNADKDMAIGFDLIGTTVYFHFRIIDKK